MTGHELVKGDISWLPVEGGITGRPIVDFALGVAVRPQKFRHFLVLKEFGFHGAFNFCEELPGRFAGRRGP